MASETPEPSRLESARAPDDLKASVLRGGRFLLTRQGLGLVLSLVGVLAITRAIGAGGYGLYAAAFGIAFFAQATSELSLDVYLVRFPGDLGREVCDQVFTLLVILAVVATAALVAAAPAIAHFVQIRDFEPIAVAMFASIPLTQLQQVHLSRLERSFDYKRIGAVELAAQVGYLAVALPAAFAMHSAWAPVMGWWFQQLILLVGFWVSDAYRPRLLWVRVLALDALKYGLVTNSSNFVYSTRTLVAPILVSRLLGATGVGYIALALRLVQQLGFVQLVMLRISIAVLGKVADDGARLRRAMTQGAEMQLLSVGIPLTCFSLVAAKVIPLVFGSNWAPVARLLPVLSIPYMALSLFSVVTATLSLDPRPWRLLITQASNAGLLWLGALIFIPKCGIAGYAYAELCTMASWVVADRLLVLSRPRPDYRYVLPWWLGLSAASIAPVTTWWTLVAIPVALALPGSVRELRSIARTVVQPSTNATFA